MEGVCPFFGNRTALVGCGVGCECLVARVADRMFASYCGCGEMCGGEENDWEEGRQISSCSVLC